MSVIRVDVENMSYEELYHYEEMFRKEINKRINKIIKEREKQT